MSGRIIFGSFLATLAIDGSEQKVISSKDRGLEGAFFSTKKRQHSITTLVAISLDGKIRYISNSSPGSQNDNQLANRTLSEWYEKLNHDEYVLADAGFNQQQSENLRVITPSGTAETFKEVSSPRILVEHAFTLIKCWQACNQRLRMSLENTEANINKTSHDLDSCVSAFVNQFHDFE